MSDNFLNFAFCYNEDRKGSTYYSGGHYRNFP